MPIGNMSRANVIDETNYCDSSTARLSKLEINIQPLILVDNPLDNPLGGVHGLTKTDLLKNAKNNQHLN